MSFIFQTIWEIFKSLPNTIIISLVAMTVGLCVGTLFAIIQIRKTPIFSQFIIVYNSFIRSTPLIIQLFILYYGIPNLILYLNATLGLKINPDMFSPMLIALIAFSLHAIAYLSETMKSGLLSVDYSQIEAAKTVGLSNRHIYTRIVLPQAFNYALPNIENQFIMLIKGTSLAFAVQVTEIMAVSRIIANEGYQFITVYSIAASFYWILAIILEKVFHKIESNSTNHLSTQSSI